MMPIHWNPSPIIWSWGPLMIRWYGLMFLIGFSVSYQMMKKICDWEGYPSEKMDSLLVHIVLGTTIGARLAHCLFYDPDYYLSHPLDILKIWEGGLASHGGGTGVIIAIWLFIRKNPEFKLMWLFDRCAIFTVFTGSLIRIGNIMNSEIIGRPTDGTWGVIFDRVDPLPRHPAQLYESACYLVIATIAWLIYNRKRDKLPQGLLFGFVIAAIFVCRFSIEFIKENQSPFERDLVLNMGQLLSLPFIGLGVFFVHKALQIGKAQKVS